MSEDSDSEREPINDEVADQAAELIQEADEQLRERREEQADFLDTVSEEEGAELLETTCNIVGDYTVDLAAKLDGDLMDAMGRVDARLERVETEDARAYEISEVADEIAQILADATADSTWDKPTFYEAYEREGIDPLGVMLERVFTALKEERDRRQGVADGFRPK